MTDFVIKKLPYDLSSYAGLAFVGKYVKRVSVNALIDPKFPVRSGVANSAILKSFLALLCMTERTIDKHGHTLLLPEYVLEDWTTTFPEKFGGTEVIALYCGHATHEQFHSEFKSDMDLERLPSGRFDTNYLVCQSAAVAMN